LGPSSTAVPDHGRGVSSAARLAVWAGLLTGLLEHALRAGWSRLSPTPIFVDAAAIFTAPTSAAVAFVPLVIAAWGIAQRWSADLAWRWAVGVASFLGIFNLALLTSRVHVAALVLASAGVATHVVRLARRAPAEFDRLVRVTTPALAAVALLGAVVTTVWRASRERALIAASGETAESTRPDAPNVLLLVLDTVRASELSTYGYERDTSPHLTAFARDGVRFERAHSTAPWTLPSHATLFTGQYERDLRVGWRTALGSTKPTLASRFAALGYATGGFVGNLIYGYAPYGLEQGFQVYRDHAFVWSGWAGATHFGRFVIERYNQLFEGTVFIGRKSDRLVVDEFLDWERQVSDRPYFAFVNLFDAHAPYAPESPYDHLFLEREPFTRNLVPGRRLRPEDVRGLRDAYDGAVASADAQLGRLMDEMRRRGRLDRTIVVVTADHGEEFAEHGTLGHGHGLHLPALHVPLVVRWPAGGVRGGTTVETPVSLRDVAATIVDLAGAQGEDHVPGHSLAGFLRGADGYDSSGAVTRSPVLSELYRATGQPDWYPSARGNIHALVQGRYHLIRGPGDVEELYDVERDPMETTNLASDASLADTLASMRRTLAEFPMAARGGR
jgi:arylsulfatase A-like enzyme